MRTAAPPSRGRRETAAGGGLRLELPALPPWRRYWREGGGKARAGAADLEGREDLHAGCPWRRRSARAPAAHRPPQAHTAALARSAPAAASPPPSLARPEGDRRRGRAPPGAPSDADWSSQHRPHGDATGEKRAAKLEQGRWTSRGRENLHAGRPWWRRSACAPAAHRPPQARAAALARSAPAAASLPRCSASVPCAAEVEGKRRARRRRRLQGPRQACPHGKGRQCGQTQRGGGGVHRGGARAA